MSPIHPDNVHRYPPDWSEISRRIKWERAGGQCECEGECGMPGHVTAGGRCENRHFELSVYTGARVVLTTAHLNHEPEDCSDENLKAMCQGCHLWYDREHHAESARARRRAAATAAGQLELPIDETSAP